MESGDTELFDRRKRWGECERGLEESGEVLCVWVYGFERSLLKGGVWPNTEGSEDFLFPELEREREGEDPGL